MPDQREPSSPEALQRVLTEGVPLGRWKEGLLFEGINPTPGLASAANWYPRTEQVGPDEMRITFMGSAPMIRPGQMNTSIFVELGSGDNFVFDLGEGSIANYNAAGLAMNQLDKVFITHLHVDHFGALVAWQIPVGLGRHGGHRFPHRGRATICGAPTTKYMRGM